ncbi:MAG TPA: AMP-binding protein [Ramlibacter sp.]|nr:AMP-binding protein [Ramlibacter sp.]
MPEAAQQLVHAPLAQWAAQRGGQVAIDDGHETLSFAQLHEETQRIARELDAAGAPATVWAPAGLSTLRSLTQFLGIVASGRCAAVGDAQWPPATRAAAQALLPEASAHGAGAAGPLSPFYVGFTSGSTGVPKGFRRHHLSWVESFRACLDAFGPDAAACVLAPGAISHSLFLFGMMLGLWSGGGVRVQEKFSAARALGTMRDGHAPCMVAVPSQLLMMLELAERRALAPIAEVRLILISGARWMRERTPQLKALFPQARVVEFYGASETSFVAWMDADEAAPANAVGRPFAGVEVDIRRRDAADEAGLIYVRSPMLFSDYVGGANDGTAALRDGEWLSVRDMGHLDAQGRLCLLGRENRMVVTLGKNLFPEEVETVLAAYPGVASVSVQGAPDPVRGQQVLAIVRPHAAGSDAGLNATALGAWCRERLEAFKLPRRYLVCEAWPLTPGGKTDHAALARALAAHLGGHGHEASPCLRPLP